MAQWVIHNVVFIYEIIAEISRKSDHQADASIVAAFIVAGNRNV